MSPRAFVIAAAVAVLIVAGFLLNTQVHAVTPAGETVSCGSVWSPSNSDGEAQTRRINLMNGLNQLAGTSYPYRPNLYVGYEAACSDAIDTRGTWGWTVTGIGVLALAGALLVSTKGRLENGTPGQ